MAGSRAAAEDQNCGTMCKVGKAIKSAFIQKPEPYSGDKEKRSTLGQVDAKARKRAIDEASDY